MIEIRQTRPGAKRREIWSDGELLRAAPIDVVRAAGVDDTSDLSPDALRTLFETVEPHCAHERALRLIGYRERSVFEVRTRLTEDGYLPRTIETLLDRLVDVGLVDDARFAGVYVRTKRSAGWGRRRVARGLADAGIDDDVAVHAMAEDLPPDGELERALGVISTRTLRTVSDRERALRKLLTRGFDFDAAKKAVNIRFSASSDGDAELTDC